MSLLTPPPTAPQRGDRTTFASRVDAFITWLIGLVPQMNSYSANLNALAAGGAYAIPFQFNGNAAVGGGIGRLSLWDGGDALSATRIAFDAFDARGIEVKALLDAMFFAGTTSAAKGFVKLTKQTDPTKWAAFRVDAWAYFDNAGQPYGTLSVTCVGYSNSAPFSLNDPLVMDCQRTGDKGDNGAADLPTLYVRDERSAGTQGGAYGSGVWNQRTLNTTRINSIPGASLTSNQITLPAGKYNFVASATGYGCDGHQVRLFNLTDSTGDVGTSAVAANGSTNVSTVRGQFTISSPKVFALQHYFTVGGSASTGGRYVGVGTEVYAEVLITKAI